MAPVYTPELAAEAILEAAERPRDDLLVGWPTLVALTANTVAPRLVDRYLAATGYEAQQTDEPEPAGAQSRPDNLFAPVELDVEAAGPFGDETRERAVRVPAPVARGALAVTAVAAAAGLAALGRFSRNGSG